MAGINVEWAVAKLTAFLELTEPQYIPPSSGFITSYSTYRLRSARAEDVVAEAHVVEQILAQVLGANWRSLQPTLDNINGSAARWMPMREVVHRALTQLRSQDELRANLGDGAPQLDAATLHPWVWDACRALWNAGTYRFALVAAATVINSKTQTKVGRHDISDHDLLAQAFSTDKPKTGVSRLRLQPDDGTDTFRSRQQGAIGLARGLYMGIRNPAAHQHHDTELPENEALEQLAAFSILARWVDDAEIETANG